MRSPALPVLAALACPTAALAHAGADITGVDIEREDTVEAGFGVLVERGEDDWGWICHEAITSEGALLTPRYTRSADDVFIGVVPATTQARDAGETLYRSVDGCDWQTVEGLTGHNLSDAVFLDADTVVALTAQEDDGPPDQIFRSTDGGLTFEPVLEVGEARPSLRVRDGGDGWVWSVSFDLDEPSAARVHVSQDDGATWTTHPLDVSAWSDQQPLVVSALAARGDEAWLGVSVRTGHVLLHATEGGAASETVLTVDGSLFDAHIDASGVLWVVESQRGMHVSSDGVTFEPFDAPQPIGVGAGVDGSDVRVASSALLTGALTHDLYDSGTVAPRMRGWHVTGPVECPAGTDQAEVCAPLFADVNLPVQPEPDPGTDGTDDTDSDGDPPECGCASTPGAGTSLLALGLSLGLALRRRRRR